MALILHLIGPSSPEIVGDSFQSVWTWTKVPVAQRWKFGEGDHGGDKRRAYQYVTSMADMKCPSVP